MRGNFRKVARSFQYSQSIKKYLESKREKFEPGSVESQAEVPNSNKNPVEWGFTSHLT